MEHQTPENIWHDLDHAIAHETVFHQFMLYTPMPGTPLHQQMGAKGLVRTDVDLADTHGQFKFNFLHPAISRDQSKELLDTAFARDFERNGPSLYRLMRTMFERCRKYGADHDPRVRERVARAADQLRSGYAGALWAMERYTKPANHGVSDRIGELRQQIGKEFGLVPRLIGPSLGRLLLWTSQREMRRMPTLEPRTFVERTNWA